MIEFFILLNNGHQSLIDVGCHLRCEIFALPISCTAALTSVYSLTSSVSRREVSRAMASKNNVWILASSLSDALTVDVTSDFKKAFN